MSTENDNIPYLTSCDSAVAVIKAAILKSQARAAQAVNQEMLALYYGIGRYISHNSRQGTWGTNAIKLISEQLKNELPGLRGFSETSLRKMRIFYEQWQLLENRPPVADEMQELGNEDILISNAISLLNHPPMAGDLDINDFLSISFSHHDEILSKTSTLEERVFYIHKAATLKWDKYTLRNNLKADLYHHQADMPNNFVATIPDKRLAMKTLKMFKDEYLLDFINVEQIDEVDSMDIDERVIEKSIVMNIKNFIMTFGKGFTYRGHQVHYDKFGVDSWVDLLFFNRELNSLVCVELKKGEFKTAYLGQLAAYLRILDDEEKLPHENPSIGVILCKEANKSFVEYVLQDYNRPMGVATYATNIERLKQLLPPEEDMKKLIDNSIKEDEL
ncbi:MAG: DUF1016 family protein [Paludibacteraceae bacterium]|nr:DUF1016 family protein [Paludibacteraceae bacterium]